MGISVATKAFFKLLFNRELSRSFQDWVDSGGKPRLGHSTTTAVDATNVNSGSRSANASTEKVKPTQAEPTRSDALTLLAALQREARLIDIIKEPLDSYTDAQIGAAARDVLKNAGSVIDRMFGLEPATEKSDGEPITVTADSDASLFRLVGNVTGSPPFQGVVAHHGWQATRCDLPKWSGQRESSLVVAPIEVEVNS